MYAPALALLSAALIGIGEFCAHFGLRRVRPLTGVFLGTCYQVLALSVFVAIWGDWDVGPWWSTALFFLVGVIHPGAYFVALLNAIDRLGPARAIMARSTSPFFAVALAVLFLAERPGFQVVLGLVLIVGGVMFLTKGKGGKGTRSGDWGIALMAAFFSGLAPAVTKAALNLGGRPVMGALFAVIGGMVAIVAVNTVLERKTGGAFWIRRIPRPAVWLFLPMGVLTGLAYITWFTALSVGSVSVVVPLVQLSPLFAIGMSRVFLRSEERIDLRLLIAALVLVLGAVLVSLGRT